MDSPQYSSSQFAKLPPIPVLNLIINGQSSIQSEEQNIKVGYIVLNLIINGQSSILKKEWFYMRYGLYGFKPYYKWIVLNTIKFVN